MIVRWIGLAVCLTVGVTAPESRGQTDTLRTDTPGAQGRLPSPRGALLRSAVLPGWGQFYNRKPLKGSLMGLMEAGLLAGVLLERDRTGAGGLTPLGNGLLLGMIGVHIYGMADAYVDAHLADFDRPDAFGRRRLRSPPALMLGLRLCW